MSGKRKNNLGILEFDDPLDAVFLRIMAWEIYIAKKNFRAKDITGELLQFVRQELGLPLTTGGAPQQFINDLRTANLIETNDHEIFPTNANIWEAEWRLLYCPSHGATRHLSQMPIVSIDNKQQKGHVSFLITLRDSALSSIKVFIGTDRPTGLNSPIMKSRGIYVLGLENNGSENEIYIGKTTEFGVRSHDHFKSKNIKWWIFFSPEEISLSKDALDAAESLMISYWSEISYVRNKNRGSDQKPELIYLQQANLFVKSCSAIYIWLARSIGSGLGDEISKYFDKDTEIIHFKKRRNFGAKCYLPLDEKE